MTARNTTLKDKVTFAKVDLRQERWVGHGAGMNVGCPAEDCSENVLIFRKGVPLPPPTCRPSLAHEPVVP
jgi:hypothetical protein